MILNRKKLRVNYDYILVLWLEDKKDKIKISSFMKYKFIIKNYISKELGSVDFKKINERIINNFFDLEVISELSDSTKNLIMIVIKSSIKYGIEKKFRKQNINIKTKITKPKSKVIYFTKNEQDILDKYLRDNLNLQNLAIIISLYTGIRVGEVCGLQWKDINFYEKTLSISKTVQRIISNDNISKTRLLIDSPKTESSIRTIPLPEHLIKILKLYKSNDENFILSNSPKPKDPRSVEKYFTNVLKNNNIRILNFHALRHTFATRSREAGIDIKVLSKILGHSSYHTTQEIYVHETMDFMRDSMNIVYKYMMSSKVR